MAASMRPLTLGEILDRTVQLYRRNFLLLVGIATPAAALIVLISGTVVIFFSSQMVALGHATQTGQAPPQAQVTQSAMVIGLVIGLFLLIGVPLLIGIFAVTLTALNFAAYQAHRGEKTTIRGSYAFAFKNFWRYVGILFLQSLFAWVIPYLIFIAMFVIGAILSALLGKSGGGDILGPILVILAVLLTIVLAVGGVLIWLRLSLAYPVSVAENLKAWPSLKRSNQLTGGTRGRIFIMFLLVFVVSIVATVALMIPLDIGTALFMRKSFSSGQPPAAFLNTLQIVNLASGFLVRIFIMPIYSTALVLFYVDQRTRLEGYDIEQLMSQAGWTELPAPPDPQPYENFAPVEAFPSTPPPPENPATEPPSYVTFEDPTQTLPPDQARNPLPPPPPEEPEA